MSSNIFIHRNHNPMECSLCFIEIQENDKFYKAKGCVGCACHECSMELPEDVLEILIFLFEFCQANIIGDIGSKEILKDILLRVRREVFDSYNSEIKINYWYQLIENEVYLLGLDFKESFKLNLINRYKHK